MENPDFSFSVNELQENTHDCIVYICNKPVPLAKVCMATPASVNTHIHGVKEQKLDRELMQGFYEMSSYLGTKT